jgi:azurin
MIMKLLHLAAVGVLAVASGSLALAGVQARTINLTAGDDMKYSTPALTAKPGESLHVVLKNTGTMPKMAAAHNFVLLKASTKPEAVATASMTAQATGYIPDQFKADILAHTNLAGPNETVDVTFTAPKAPGTYPFLCTFPGHFASGMKGTLTVK